ncbi:hypothetical protein Barb7_02074 [Bacteroidales bacterium Barb7]|nr:hypothetical protein Barb7_02074 [Bacteroidales bacterium Barb7]
MGGVFQDVVGGRGCASFHFEDFPADTFQYFNETVEFRLAFAFGRLYHQCAVDGKGEGGSVIAEVHQAFGDVGLVDAGAFFQRAAFED